MAWCGCGVRRAQAPRLDLSQCSNQADSERGPAVPRYPIASPTVHLLCHGVRQQKHVAYYSSSYLLYIVETH